MSWKLEALSPLLHAYSTMPPLHSSLLVKITWRGLSCQHGVLGFFSFRHLYCPLFKTRFLSSGIVSILCHLWMPLSFFLCCCCFVCFHLTVLMSLQCSQECCHFWFENFISKWLYFCLSSVSAGSWGCHFHLENSTWECQWALPGEFQMKRSAFSFFAFYFILFFYCFIGGLFSHPVVNRPIFTYSRFYLMHRLHSDSAPRLWCDADDLFIGGCSATHRVQSMWWLYRHSVTTVCPVCSNSEQTTCTLHSIRLTTVMSKTIQHDAAVAGSRTGHGPALNEAVCDVVSKDYSSLWSSPGNYSVLVFY